MGVQDTAASGISGSEVQPYDSILDPQQIWQVCVSNPQSFRKVPYVPSQLSFNPGSSCVGGVVVYPLNHIGVVIEHALLLDGPRIKVASTLDGVLVAHPIETPDLGCPDYFLIKECSMDAP